MKNAYQILLVEDNNIAQRMTSMMLEQQTNANIVFRLQSRDEPWLTIGKDRVGICATFKHGVSHVRRASFDHCL